MKKFIEFQKINIIFTAFLLIFISVFIKNFIGHEIINPQGINALKEITKSFFTPDLSNDTIKIALDATYQTLIYAICGISIALLLGFILSLISAGVLTSNNFFIFLSNKTLTLFRGIHPLIWGIFFVSTIGLTPFSGIFAIGISYAGAIGRVFSDNFKNVPKEPLNLLKSNGASKLTLLFYCYLPFTIVDLISYFMYRFECSIRTSIIMSFIGLGGLGYEIHLALNDLYYNKMWTYIFFLLILVIIIEIWGNKLRKEMISS